LELIKLSNGSYTKVDDDLYPFLSRYRWSCSAGYALTAFRILENISYTVTMHRLIMRMSNKNVDHINGDKLDNRVCNLRYCERSQNSINYKRPNKSTGYRGVYNNSGGRYSARITINGKKTTLGTYDTKIEAAQAYDRAAQKYHKEFAVYNFPKKLLGDV